MTREMLVAQLSNRRERLVKVQRPYVDEFRTALIELAVAA